MSLEFSTERDPLTEKIIGCAIEVHKQLGPGLLEATYESALAVEFEQVAISKAGAISDFIQRPYHRRASTGFINRKIGNSGNQKCGPARSNF